MQEKQKELFDQYDMELLHVRRGRGGLICEAGEGIFDLQVCNLSPKRLEQAFEIKEQLLAQGFFYVDQYYRNKDGTLLTYDRYQTPYIMKKHYEGRECDIRNKRDIEMAGEELGRLHAHLRKISIEGYPFKQNRFEQKTRELLRTRQYIAKKNEKKEFEVLFHRYFDLFWKDIDPGHEEAQYIPALCHGSYHQHHMIMLPGQKLAVIQFENFYAGNQLEDLFYLMRKILEKNQYDITYAQRLLEAYERQKRLSREEYQCLFQMLSYPEKYWKLANQYMNHKKSFLSPKLVEKLRETVQLEEKKQKFLRFFWLFYLQ